jgi:PIN domain nuclease of toxin-antitoxin system
VKALLDTHVFLWSLLGDERLSARARTLLEDTRNEVYFSAASAFEIALKVTKGRLELPEPPETLIPSRLATFAYEALPIGVDHAVRAAQLPPIHADPWDRLLIAQAQLEGLPIISADPVVAQYDVVTIW